MSKPKVLVGYPSPDRTDHRFNKCLLDLILQNWLDVDLFLTNAVGSRITQNRNTIVEEAYKVGATHILWIDADTQFPPGALKRLLAHDKDIVCATTSRRIGQDRSPAAYPLDVKSIVPFQQLVPMRLVGFPFMLTKLSVFDRLEKPYFAEPPRNMMGSRASNFVIKGSEDLIPEDEYFCIIVRELGYEILCDMQLSMEIGHVGTTVYYIDNPFPKGVDGAIKFEPNIDIDLLQTDEDSIRSQDGVGE